MILFKSLNAEKRDKDQGGCQKYQNMRDVIYENKLYKKAVHKRYKIFINAHE